jgi:hypothetical protein
MSKDFIQDVLAFNKKFGIMVNDDPTYLTKRKLQERIDFLQEELDEFKLACDAQDLPEQADALVDLVYVALGTAVMLGLPFQELWDDVQRANMAKERGISKRGNLVDCIKPTGWQGPMGNVILMANGWFPPNRERPNTWKDDPGYEVPKKTITIFEGCDGAGKSTHAKAYAESIGAKYVHFGSFEGVEEGHLILHYLKALDEFFDGTESVVFDRSWYSEAIYGNVYRHGLNRLHPSDIISLDYACRNYHGIVVKCDPTWDNVYSSFLSRRKDEMLDNDDQLWSVYTRYTQLKFNLPSVVFDYTKHTDLNSMINNLREKHYGIVYKSLV